MLLTACDDPESAGRDGRPSTGRIEPASVPAAQAWETGKEPPGLWSLAEGGGYTGFRPASNRAAGYILVLRLLQIGMFVDIQ